MVSLRAGGRKGAPTALTVTMVTGVSAPSRDYARFAELGDDDRTSSEA
jgi:hypothetical protein